MKLEYDKEVDAAYIYVVDSIHDGAAKKTVRVSEEIIIDFDGNGKLLGVEVLNASKIINKKVLLEAQAA